MKSQSRKKLYEAGAAGKKASGPRPSKHPVDSNQTTFPIVGIGASAGGLEAFTDLLKHLPDDTGMGFVLVQHLDPQHESALSQLLARVTRLPVREVTNNLRVEPNHVYVIPPNTSLAITQGVLRLHPRLRNRTPVRSIDAFFESLAQDQRERAIGVVLSGTASDGTVGLEAIKAEDGITFAQDDSARYDSMPRSAVVAGCVDFVLKPEDIAKELARIAKHPYIAGQFHESTSSEEDRALATARKDDQTPLPSGGHGATKDAKAALGQAVGAHHKAGHDGYGKIILLLRNHSGVDFSLYKSTTIRRRINRRVVLNKLRTIDEYANFARGNAKELDALYSDVLINVTSFFRNPEAFDLLKRNIFPKLLQQRCEEPVRVWVLGCSTGQEAYSIAMAFSEVAEHVPRARKLQVFATDLNDALLDKARHALYAKTLAQDISPERLRRFFVEEEGGYRVIKPLRNMVVFARQNLITDPPFSHIDLISCRNLLIYLDPALQQKAIPTFHYALNPEGILFLGASESIGGFSDLFEPADRKSKIFVRKSARIQTFPLPVKKDWVPPDPMRQRPPLPLGKGSSGPSDPSPGDNAQREADRISVNRFAPPGVLINADLQILQFRGPTGPYLQPPATGKATLNVLKMAREDLLMPLRAAINKARKENKIVRKSGIGVPQNGQTHAVNLEVIPLKNLRERCFLILFENTERAAGALPGAPADQRRLPATQKEADRRINVLETELSETRDYLQSIQEQHEAANEELQASNEEVQSANEELQSINEELETSKEELESANEELTTVNEEMARRNAELNRLNADLTNFQASTKLPVILVGRDLTIQRFSAPAEKIFNLLVTDIGRPLKAVHHQLLVPETGRLVPSAPRSYKPFPLEDFIHQVIDTVREHEREACDHEGHWFSLRARPYITVDSKVDGALLLLIEITELKRIQQEITIARDYAEATIHTARDPMLVLRADLRVDRANEAFYKTFKVSPRQTENVLIYELNDGQWNIPKLRELLEGIIPRNGIFKDFEVIHEFEGIGTRTLFLNAHRLDNPSGLPEKIVLGIEDVTERQRSEESLRQARAEIASRTAQLEKAVSQRTMELTASNSQLEAFIYSVAHDLRAPLRAMQGFSSLLVQRAGTALDETCQKYAQRIDKSAQFMDAMLIDMLAFSRISQQRLELAAVNLQTVVASVLSRLQEDIREKNARVEASGAWPTVLAFQPILEQVLTNLVSNALKFVPPGTAPVVRLRAEDIQDFVRVSVEDNGVGIEPDYQTQIFRLFNRLHGDKYPGTGIGLAIVQKGVERMGGNVGVESTPGQGSRFWIDLRKVPPG